MSWLTEPSTPERIAAAASDTALDVNTQDHEVLHDKVQYLIRPIKRVLQYILYVHWGVLVTIGFAVLAYLAWEFSWISAPKPSGTPTPRFLIREIPKHGDGSRISQPTQEEPQRLAELMEWCQLVAVPALIGFFDWTKLVALLLVLALVAVLKIGYEVAVKWIKQQKQSRARLVESSVDEADTADDAVIHTRTNPTSFVPSAPSGLVYSIVLRTVHAVETIRDHHYSAVGAIRKYSHTIAGVALVTLGLADYNLSWGLTDWLADHTTYPLQAMIGDWFSYPNMAHATRALILAIVFRRWFFAIIAFFGQTIANIIEVVWTLLSEMPYLAAIYYYGIVDLARGFVEVVWAWPWKYINWFFVGLVAVTAWTAVTMSLGIWTFYYWKGPLPVLDMIIKYTDGEDGLRVRVVQ